MNGIEIQRRKKGLTQSELALDVGVSQANVSQWESGEALPRTDKLPILAKVLDCKTILRKDGHSQQAERDK